MNKKDIVKNIAYFGVLAIFCILAFLVAKYLVRDEIDWKKPPVDVSEKI